MYSIVYLASRYRFISWIYILLLNFDKKVKAGGETVERCNKTKKDLAIVGLGTTTDFLETQKGLTTGLSTSVRKKMWKKNPRM